MQKPTYIVVGVDDTDSRLKQSAIMGELRPEMELIAWCWKRSDADIIQRTWQEMNLERGRTYIVVANRQNV